MNALSGAEREYIARWLAIVYPDVAEQAMADLAKYEKDYPDEAARMAV